MGEIPGKLYTYLRGFLKNTIMLLRKNLKNTLQIGNPLVRPFVDRRKQGVFIAVSWLFYPCDNHKYDVCL